MITEAVKSVFNTIDADQDGFISLEDFEEYAGTLSEADKKKFRDLSSSGNGKLSFEDFATF